MKLFIKTGGKGLRLKHLTHDIPKPMLELVGKPVLEHLVDWGRGHGVDEIVMLNGYLHEIIEDYFGDGDGFGIKISHCNEDKPLGSGGGVRNAMHLVDEPFALISGDVFCRVDLRKMIESHKNADNAIMTIFLHTSDHPEDSDIMQVDDDNKIVKFVSKKDDHTGAGNLGNAGLFIVEPEVEKYMDKEVFTFETYLFPKMLEAGEYLNAHITEEYMKDMGTPERLKKVEDYIKNE